MYWDGEKEVTKERVREIYDEELKRQGVHEMWTLNPGDFECRECPILIVIITNENFSAKRLEDCYENDDFSCYLPLLVDNDIKECQKLFKGLKCVYHDGRWLDAD